MNFQFTLRYNPVDTKRVALIKLFRTSILTYVSAGTNIAKIWLSLYFGVV